MKKTSLLTLAAFAAVLMTGCVFGFRSNMNFICHENKATTEAKIEDRSSFGNGSPTVNADKEYSDLLNNSGNGNSAGSSNASNSAGSSSASDK